MLTISYCMKILHIDDDGLRENSRFLWMAGRMSQKGGYGEEVEAKTLADSVKPDLFGSVKIYLLGKSEVVGHVCK